MPPSESTVLVWSTLLLRKRRAWAPGWGVEHGHLVHAPAHDDVGAAAGAEGCIGGAPPGHGAVGSGAGGEHPDRERECGDEADREDSGHHGLCATVFLPPSEGRIVAEIHRPLARARGRGYGSGRRGGRR